MGNPLRNLRFWLFIATFISCAFAATFYSGQFNVENPLNVYNPLSISYGLPFALSLMFILLSHESGHYFAAKWWKTKVTGPLFIPVPISPIGTMGAIIRMDPGTITNRRALFDIGAAGPWSGVFAALLVMYFSHSYQADERIFGQMSFAILVSIIITGINLFPIGQLDGGHVLYTISGAKYRTIELLSIVFLTIYMVFFQVILSPAILIFILFFIGLQHPPTQNDDIPLGIGRKLIAGLTMALFFVILLLITMISAASCPPMGICRRQTKPPKSGLQKFSKSASRSFFIVCGLLWVALTFFAVVY